MLQLLVVFFAPYYIFGMAMPNFYRFYAVIIGFSLNYAAYFAEIYRSGIQSIPVGQKEAAMVMVKDTSLAFALAFTEMFTMAKQIAAAQTSILPLFIAGIFYYIFNFIVAFGMEKLEKRLDYYH